MHERARWGPLRAYTGGGYSRNGAERNGTELGSKMRNGTSLKCGTRLCAPFLSLHCCFVYFIAFSMY